MYIHVHVHALTKHLTFRRPVDPGFSHRSVKWWKRVFFHLLDLTRHILYKAATSSNITQLDFRLSVAKDLIEGLERPHHRHHEPAPKLPLRLTERAFPEPIPGGKRADCKVCKSGWATSSDCTGASCATQPCAYTLVLSVITRSKATNASTEAGSYPSLSSLYTLSSITLHVHQASRPTQIGNNDSAVVHAQPRLIRLRLNIKARFSLGVGPRPPWSPS